MKNEVLRALIGDDADAWTEFARAPTGVSGSTVIMLQEPGTGSKYVLKMGDSRTTGQTIQSQAEQRARLAPHFGEKHLPKIREIKGDAMLMEMVEGDSLHHLVAEGRIGLPELCRVSSGIMCRFRNVWFETRRPFQTRQELARDPLKRLERINAYLRRVRIGQHDLEEIVGKPLHINGRALPPMRELLLSMERLYQPPRYAVFCHGDPNGENILVDQNHNWFLIDWEWTGWHDWRVQASFLFAWWISNASQLKSWRADVKENRVEIDFELGYSKHVGIVMKEAWHMASQVGDIFGEPNWREQVMLQSAVLLLGDLRFLARRRRPLHTYAILAAGLQLLALLS